jgi:putative two-component system response regulator
MTRKTTSAQSPIELLLVEDNDDDATLIARMLAKGDDPTRLHLTHVRCLEEALSEITSAPVQAILLDLSLPDASGSTGCDAYKWLIRPSR